MNQLRLPKWAQLPLALMLMDYTLFLWHILTHRVPFLWRFHVVHHTDVDLTATTALRFHFAEMLLSVPWRAAQVLLLGIGPFTLSLWQKLALAEITFSPFEFAPAGLDRASAGALDCDAADAWYPSLSGARRDGFVLVQRTDRVGPAARHAPDRCAAAGH